MDFTAEIMRLFMIEIRRCRIFAGMIFFEHNNGDCVIFWVGTLWLIFYFLVGTLVVLNIFCDLLCGGCLLLYLVVSAYFT